VAVTAQSPAAVFDNKPPDSEQPVPVTTKVTEPFVVPPLVVNVRAEPYVPDVDVTVSEDCAASANVTVVAELETGS
jgi:hypothetical protein